jgi:hypothetical protein
MNYYTFASYSYLKCKLKFQIIIPNTTLKYSVVTYVTVLFYLRRFGIWFLRSLSRLRIVMIYLWKKYINSDLLYITSTRRLAFPKNSRLCQSSPASDYPYSKTNELHFLYSIYYELTTSECFQHYLLIFRRRYTNYNWYFACVLCLLVATRIGVEPTDVTLMQNTNCSFCSAF